MISTMNEQARYGQLIRSSMAARGMTQRDVADITGWSQSVVSDILNGKRTLTPPEVVRTLAQVLEIPIRDQLEALGFIDEDEPQPGIAYEVPVGSLRADLLDALRDAPDELVQLLTRTAEGSMEILAIARSGHGRARDRGTNSRIDAPTNRTA